MEKKKEKELDRQIEDLLHRNSYDQAEYLLQFFASYVFLTATSGPLPPDHLERVEHVLQSFAELRYERVEAFVRGLREERRRKLSGQSQGWPSGRPAGPEGPQEPRAPPGDDEAVEAKAERRGEKLLEKWKIDGLIR